MISALHCCNMTKQLQCVSLVKCTRQLSIQEILILLAVAMLQRSILKHRIRQEYCIGGSQVGTTDYWQYS